MQGKRFVSMMAIVIMLVMSCAPGGNNKVTGVSGTYDDLVTLYAEFQEFQKPEITNGAPDYTATAMKKQYRGLKQLQKRLSAFNITSWPVSQQVDYHIVRAEMNGMEFQHRVLRPWSSDPGFYLTRNFGFGVVPRLPLPEDRVTGFQERLRVIPKILDQAKRNLTEGKGAMAYLAIRSLDFEKETYPNLKGQLVMHHPELVPDVDAVLAALDDYRTWIEENKSAMTRPVGVGKENYNWYLKNVHLTSYTWDECWTLLERDYQRGMAMLKLEENRNRKLPPLELATTEKQYAKRYNQAERYLLNFLRKEEIFTVPDYFLPTGPDVVTPAWNGPERQGPVREFFEQCSDRDPMQQIIHNFAGHHYDGLLEERDNRPIRSARHRFGVSQFRAESLALGLEEALMHAGLFDKRRRGREIIDIALAYRAVRGMADLKMHSNDYTYAEAVQFDVDACPYGWAVKDGYTIWAHKNNTPRVPGFELGYTMGKIQFDKLMADRAHQLGHGFNLREFIDTFRAAGMIPISLIRWEMTGLDDEMKEIL